MNVHVGVASEASSLGRMEQISDVLAIGRGYGIRLQLYYQDLGQIRKCWPDGARPEFVGQHDAGFLRRQRPSHSGICEQSSWRADHRCGQRGHQYGGVLPKFVAGAGQQQSQPQHHH